MKIGLFVLGVVTGLAFNRIPHYANRVWTAIPPGDPADYAGPRFRNWKNGEEI